MGIIVALLSTLLVGLPIIGIVFGLWVAAVVALNIVGLLAGALLGALIFGRSDGEWLGEPGVQARWVGNEKEMVGLARWQHRRSHRCRGRCQFFHG